MINDVFLKMKALWMGNSTAHPTDVIHPRHPLQYFCIPPVPSLGNYGKLVHA